ncbi:MAG: DUF6036 family nucleotidyltransferase [Candidatus Margulisiibacteriota bacterium]
MKNKNHRELYYEDIIKKLNKKKIKYLLIGGIAVNLHGVQRATGDMDIMLAMDKSNLLKFVSAVEELGLEPKVPVDPRELADPVKVNEWKRKKNMKVFSFWDIDNPYIVIDVMTENYIAFERAYKRRKVIESWGVKVPIISMKDLIELKKIAGRPQDLADIEALKKYGAK